MHRTSSGVVRALSRLGVVATAAATIGVGIVGHGAAADAATPATVTFTSHGIDTGSAQDPQSLTIRPGSDVVFVNDVDPTDAIPLLGTVTGLLRSVTVTVTGASQQRFTVGRGQQRVVPDYGSGSTPFVIHFAATYQAQTVLGPDPTTRSFQGTITVAATPVTPAPHPTTQPAPSSDAAAPGHTSTGAVPSSKPGDSARAGAGDPSQSTGGSRAALGGPASGAAGATAPQGGAAVGDPDTTSTAAPTPVNSRLPATAGPSRQAADSDPAAVTTTRGAAGSKSAPEPGTSPSMDPAAAEAPMGAVPFDINWPAIAAVVLLGMVTVALVHVLVTRRRPD